MINIGDKVKFLNMVGGGVVISFQSNKVAVVEDKDGFEIPVLITELVKYDDKAPKKHIPLINLDPGKPKPKPEPKLEVKADPVFVEGNNEPKFFMAFHPSNQNNPLEGEIEVFLINDSNFTILYHYVHFTGEKYKTIDAGELEPNTKTYLEGLAQADLNNLPKFHFRIIPFMKESKKLIQPIVKDISVNSVKFYKERSFKLNDFFPGKAMIFDLLTNPMQEAIDRLTEKDFKEVVEAKDKANRPEIPEQVKIVPPESVEVDLHIESLVEKTSGLSNHEILEIQMERFFSEMKSAIEKRAKRIIFIHGVGNGVLKQEIHKKLQSTYARYSYQDASFQEYGYGATLVILRRK